MAPPCEYGLFMGYKMHSGGVWGKEYSVVPLRAFCFQDFSVKARGGVNAKHVKGVQDIWQHLVNGPFF